MKSIPPFPYDKRILFFDTETSGLNPKESEILQLSYIIVDGTTWNILKKVNFYFAYPEDEWRVSPRAIEVNHLTKEFLSKQILTPRHEALTQFYADLQTCQLAVAHNIEFDKSHVEVAASTNKILRRTWPTTYCTMKETTDFCKIPFSNGGYGYKWPKLEELAKCLSVKYNKANLHNSLTDTRLTLECFKCLHAQKKLNTYVYKKDDNLDSPIQNAETLFPHQNAATYLGEDAPPIIIHNERLATYKFGGKHIAYSITEKQIGQTHLRAILSKMGCWCYTSQFVSSSYVIADALIISRDISSSNRQIFQQVAEFQQTHPDFPVFTIEAFRRRPEADEYEKERERRAQKRKDTVQRKKEEEKARLEEMRRNFKMEEQDRTGKYDEVKDGRYYRNGRPFESCESPVVKSSIEARLISSPIGQTLCFERKRFHKNWARKLKVGDYLQIQAVSGTKDSIIVFFNEKVLWTGQREYIRRFLDGCKSKIARVIKVEDRKTWDETIDEDSMDSKWVLVYDETWVTMMFYSWHNFEKWDGAPRQT